MTGNTSKHVYARSGPDAKPGLGQQTKTRIETETKRPAVTSFQPAAQLIVQGMKLSAEEMTSAGEASAVSTGSTHMHVATSSGTLTFQSLSVEALDEFCKLEMYNAG